MSSAYVVCCIYLQTFQTYIMHIGKQYESRSDWSGSTLFATMTFKVEDQADDNCCDWRFKG